MVSVPSEMYFIILNIEQLFQPPMKLSSQKAVYTSCYHYIGNKLDQQQYHPLQSPIQKLSILCLSIKFLSFHCSIRVAILLK